MKIPAIKGIIRRRLLLNYRVSPEVIQAIAGICLTRLSFFDDLTITLTR